MLQESHRGTRPPPTRLLLLRQKHLVPISSRFKATPAEPQFPWAAATEPELGLCPQPHPQALGLSFLHGVGRKSSPQDACSEKGYTVRPHARSRGPGRPPSPDRLPPASPSSGVSLGLFLSPHATPPCDSRGLGCAPTQSHVYKHPTPPGPAWRYVLARFSLGNGTAQSRGEPSSEPGLQGAVLPSLLIAVSPGEAAGQGGRGTWTWKLGAEWGRGTGDVPARSLHIRLRPWEWVPKPQAPGRALGTKDGLHVSALSGISASPCAGLSRGRWPRAAWVADF